MNLLRSPLFSVLVAVFLFSGCPEMTSGACLHDAEMGCAGGLEHSAPTGEPSDTAWGDHGCQCLYHQTFTLERLAVPALAGMPLETSLDFLERTDFPPDAIPLGIDYPPQLA